MFSRPHTQVQGTAGAFAQTRAHIVKKVGVRKGDFCDRAHGLIVSAWLSFVRAQFTRRTGLVGLMGRGYRGGAPEVELSFSFDCGWVPLPCPGSAAEQLVERGDGVRVELIDRFHTARGAVRARGAGTS